MVVHEKLSYIMSTRVFEVWGLLAYRVTCTPLSGFKGGRYSEDMGTLSIPVLIIVKTTLSDV